MVFPLTCRTPLLCKISNLVFSGLHGIYVTLKRGGGMGKDRYWVIADIVKRRLFDRLRKEMWKIDYLDYRKYRKGIEDIYSSILEEWENIKEEYKGDPDADFTKLRGFLYEVLFYYACLKTQTLFIDAEILEMGGKFFEEHPPWYEATPLYDIIPDLHHIWRKHQKTYFGYC